MTIKLPQEADAIARQNAVAAGLGGDVAAYVASLVLSAATAPQENRVESDDRSAYDVAKELGLIGCIKDGPVDLSTNPKHMKGFGLNQENGARR